MDHDQLVALVELPECRQRASMKYQVEIPSSDFGSHHQRRTAVMSNIDIQRNWVCTHLHGTSQRSRSKTCKVKESDYFCRESIWRGQNSLWICSAKRHPTRNQMLCPQTQWRSLHLSYRSSIKKFRNPWSSFHSHYPCLAAWIVFMKYIALDVQWYFLKPLLSSSSVLVVGHHAMIMGF